MGRPGFCITRPSFIQVRPGTPSGSFRCSRRSRISCSPSPRQTKSTSGHWSFTRGALRLAKTPPNASLTLRFDAPKCSKQCQLADAASRSARDYYAIRLALRATPSGTEHAYKTVLLDKPNASDIDLQVSFFAVEGKADMGGGL